MFFLRASHTPDGSHGLFDSTHMFNRFVLNSASGVRNRLASNSSTETKSSNPGLASRAAFNDDTLTVLKPFGSHHAMKNESSTCSFDTIRRPYPYIEYASRSRPKLSVRTPAVVIPTINGSGLAPEANASTSHSSRFTAV